MNAGVLPDSGENILVRNLAKLLLLWRVKVVPLACGSWADHTAEVMHLSSLFPVPPEVPSASHSAYSLTLVLRYLVTSLLA